MARQALREAAQRHLLIALALGSLALCPSAALGQRDAALAAAIRSEVAAISSMRERARVAPIYAERAEPVWFVSRAPRPEAAAALSALRRAGDHGLDPGDYAAAEVQRKWQAAMLESAGAHEVASADVALSAALLHFLADLRFGRLEPANVAPHFRSNRDARSVASLREAVAADRLATLIEATEPRFPLYARLERLLARYRALAQQPFVALPPLPKPKSKVEPGDRYQGACALHERLVLLGDLDAATPSPEGDRYSDALAGALRRFQQRHGLTPDGVLGRQTLAALDVTPAERVTQIALSLERLRWLPDFGARPLVAINIPSFRLWAFEHASRGVAAFSMPVIVGKAVRNETPVFIGEMRYVEFAPYWNVPRSILRNELLPRLARDPSLLAREEMELVGARGQRVDGALDETAIGALRDGKLRVRQRPGAKNALGYIKFVLPNTMDIYLHDTPVAQLFQRSRRDFSHGCIRVGDPLALARFVMRGSAEWNAAAIEAAMSAGVNRVATLPEPVPVVIFYTTALVDREGRALFLPDLYGHDRKLDEALRRRGTDG